MGPRTAGRRAVHPVDYAPPRRGGGGAPVLHPAVVGGSWCRKLTRLRRKRETVGNAVALPGLKRAFFFLAALSRCSGMNGQSISSSVGLESF